MTTLDLVKKALIDLKPGVKGASVPAITAWLAANESVSTIFAAFFVMVPPENHAQELRLRNFLQTQILHGVSTTAPNIMTLVPMQP